MWVTKQVCKQTNKNGDNRLLEKLFVLFISQDLTWDQAQFERFSYILSNGHRCNFQSETKIEPDLRLVKIESYIQSLTTTFSEK